VSASGAADQALIVAAPLTIVQGPGFLRLTLALLVFVHHTTRVSLGMAAVYVFFELSGFWICTMWNERYVKALFPYIIYLVSRWWRLVPAFVLASMLTWAAVYTLGLPVPKVSWLLQALSHTFIVGYSSLLFQPNRPAWTLDIEVQFYLIAPLLILLMQSRTLLILAACGAVSIIGLYVDYPYRPQLFPYVQVPHPTTVFPYLLFFAIGVAAASAKWRPTALVGWGALILTGAALVLCVVTPLQGLVIGGAHPGPLYHRFNESANVVVALALAPWAMYTTRQSGARFDGALGDLSYLVYIFHWPILAALNPASGSTLHRASVALAALMTVLILAIGVRQFFDRPINRARARWVARRTELRPSVSLGHGVARPAE